MKRIEAASYVRARVILLSLSRFILLPMLMFALTIQPAHAEPEASWTIIPICVEEAAQIRARISGDLITWQDEQREWKGFVYDLSTGKGVPLDMKPWDVSGDLVVGTNITNSDIIVYNVSTDTYIPVFRERIGWVPAIDGTRIVWTDERNGYLPDIYMYDLISSEETQITNSSASETCPDISGDKIAYRREEDGICWVVLYDLLTKNETVISNQTSAGCSPEIDENIVVWEDRSEVKIFMYNISSKEVSPICENTAYYPVSPSISGDIVAWMDYRHARWEGWTGDIYIYNITSGEEIRITDQTEARSLSPHSVSNGRIVWSEVKGEWTGYGEYDCDIYVAIPEVELLSEFWVETDENTYVKGENVYISGGFTFKTTATGVLLNITVLSATSVNRIYTVYSSHIDVVEGQRINFADLNDGKPFEWNTSANMGSFKIRATIHMESPYNCSVIEESEVFDVIIVVTVNPTFNSNKGSALYPPPTIWTIQLPNGTIREVSAPTTYSLTRGGNCSITSITWQGSDISPDTKPAIFLNSSTTWSPTINCKVYSLTVDPTFYDHTGTALVQPSSWSIEFPNDTIRTVYSPVTYNQTHTGKYSIVSIIWKGVEVIPDTVPTTSVTSDMLWSPSINCLLPTSLSISLSSSTSYVGFKVEINGNLTCNEVGLSGAPILLSYSVTGGESWSEITLVNTTSDGGYSAVWMPSATGNYVVRAAWAGNSTYPETTNTVNLAVTIFKDQSVFSVTSNSTVSEFAFNSTSRELSFTVAGPSGTTGYINIYIAKTLIDNIADVKIHLDGDRLNYAIKSIDDSWLLHCTYLHSTHKIVISLGSAPFIPPQLITSLSLGILTVALAVATVILIFNMRRGEPPTILNGVFKNIKMGFEPGQPVRPHPVNAFCKGRKSWQSAPKKLLWLISNIHV